MDTKGESSNHMPNVFWFFNTAKNPLSMMEFILFWQSLTAKEQDYYRTVQL